MPKGADKKRGQFIGMRKDQLGARLLMMLNAIRLAEDYKTDFRINWFPRGAMAPKLGTPSDLFDQTFIDRHFIDNADFEARSATTKPLWTFENDDSPKKLKAHLARGGDILLEEGFEIVVFPWEDSSEMQSRIRSYTDRIAFHPRVAGHMAAIERAMGADQKRHSIAYHIRRGDILNEDPWKHKEWPAKIEPDELYTAYLEKNKDSAAFVFSDQPESIARFTTSNRHVQRIDDAVDLSDCTVAQRDFLELFAMSRASEIVAPPISAFSRAAARLSGRERKCFHEVMSVPEREEAYAQVLARFEAGIDNFITPSEAAQIFAKLTRRLQESDQVEAAWHIGQAILDTGTDNAFLPLLHAINSVYLSKWDVAQTYINQALDHPHQWQENYIAALAIKAHIDGALGRRASARRSFLRAFWQKPMLPDIAVIGSYMINRDRMRPGAVLPFDKDTLLHLRLPYLQTNIALQQNKILVRRALDLSAIAIEWPWFAMDGQTKRLLDAPKALGKMQDTLKAIHGGKAGAGPYSFCALLEARKGDPARGLAMNTLALEKAPADMMVRKRQVELLWLTGDHNQALNELETLRIDAPGHAFWHFLEGQIHLADGNKKAARACLEKASAMDDSTAELHAHLSELCHDMGDKDAAIAALDRAAMIAPIQQRYENRRKRLEK
ncbi:MAG: hypothetical protein ACSHW1_04005 [Yoonia sp.]|uniref:hypothetical protein n=1 Tax=Yoonia sp. TaxID=2212373 RepID=UPI003EF63B96